MMTIMKVLMQSIFIFEFKALLFLLIKTNSRKNKVSKITQSSTVTHFVYKKWTTVFGPVF